MTHGISADLLDRLASAGRVCVLTGSGVSAESGIPTFRDAQTGLWANFRPEELATADAFERNPELVWNWYQWRRDLVRMAKPNAAHEAIAEMELIFPEFSLISQNVDGLHQLAGNKKLIEFHGNILRTICSVERCEVDNFDPEAAPPACPDCGAKLRPDVVWFGEPINPEYLERAYQDSSNCQVLFTIGTSAQVQPAAGLAETALQSGACVVEINPQRTILSDRVTFHLSGAASDILPILVRKLRRSIQ
jgi:NAD-dependent deacetylase